MATHTPGRVLVPISNWAAFGGSKEVIIWLPIDMIATTITALVALRKQVIEDIYQIMGLSDIMRGATDPERDAGRAAAQEPVRLDPHPRQAAGVGPARARPGRDHAGDHHREVRRGDDHRDEPDPAADQADDRPADQADRAAGDAGAAAGAADAANAAGAAGDAAEAGPVKQMMQQFQQMQQTGAGQHPEAAAEADDRAGAALPEGQPGAVVHARHRDRQHDHGRRADGEAAAHRVRAGAGNVAAATVADDHGRAKTAPFCGEILKFATAPYRAGRSLDGAIDDLIEQMKMKGDQPRTDPEAEKVKALTQIEKQKLEAQKQKDETDAR